MLPSVWATEHSERDRPDGVSQLKGAGGRRGVVLSKVNIIILKRNFKSPLNNHQGLHLQNSQNCLILDLDRVMNNIVAGHLYHERGDVQREGE